MKTRKMFGEQGKIEHALNRGMVLCYSKNPVVKVFGEIFGIAMVMLCLAYILCVMVPLKALGITR